MKCLKRACCIALAMTVLMSNGAFAADSVKDESVYVNLDYNGSIDKTIVVNSFKLNGNTSVIDYGNYENIKNLSSTVKPKQKDGYIEWQVSKELDNFYYQGEMKNVQLPWSFAITYKLDGVMLPAEKLIGASGNIEITIEAIANEEVNEYFRDNYMAEIIVKLDSEKCKDILCPDAITAALGSAKQLTFMVLPKLNKTYTINMTANDFEMDGINIAMVKVSDGILNNIDNVKVSVSSMSNGIDQLISGGGTLKNGASDLAQGLSLLDAGATNISQAIPSVSSGMNELSSGAATLDDGLSQISGGSSEVRNGLLQLDSNSYDISKGIGTISDGLYQMVKNKADVKKAISEIEGQKGAISEVDKGAETLKSGYTQIENGLYSMSSKASTINAGVNELKSTSTDLSVLKQGASSVQNGISSLSTANKGEKQIIDALVAASKTDPALARYADSLAQLQTINTQMGTGINNQLIPGSALVSGGVDTAQAGVKKLYAAASSFGDAASQMAEGAESLRANMVKLNGGFDTFYNGARKLLGLYDASLRFGNVSLSLIDGAQQLYDGTAELDSGFSEYASGVGELYSNYMTLDSAINDAKNGAQTLKNGVSTLQTGDDMLLSSVNEMTDSIGKLSNGASMLYDGVIEITDSGGSAIDRLTGAEGDLAGLISMSESAQTVSFAAPNVVTPNSVQFVIKTPELHIDDDEVTDEETENLNFFQKLIALFSGGKKQ